MIRNTTKGTSDMADIKVLVLLGSLRAASINRQLAELAARHVAVKRLAVQFEPGGQAFDDGYEAGSVGLACGCESETH